MLTTTTTSVSYTLTGSGQTLAVPFKFLANGDLVVKSNGATLAIGTDYSVSGAGGESGGSITLVAGTAADVVVIERLTDTQQDIDLVNGDSFDADTVEQGFDRSMAVAQEARVALGRTLRVPAGSTVDELSGSEPTNGVVGFRDGVPTMRTDAGLAEDLEIAADPALDSRLAIAEDELDDLDGIAGRVATAELEIDSQTSQLATHKAAINPHAITPALIGAASQTDFDTLETEVDGIAGAQAAGRIAFQTLALLNADLAHDENTLAEVTNDSTASNNGTYIKVGASGAGSWLKSTNDVSGRVTTLEEGQPTRDLLADTDEYGIESHETHTATVEDGRAGRSVAATARNASGKMVGGYHTDDGSPWPAAALAEPSGGGAAVSVQMGDKYVGLLDSHGEPWGANLGKQQGGTQGGAADYLLGAMVDKLGALSAADIIAGATLTSADSVISESDTTHAGGSTNWTRNASTAFGGSTVTTLSVASAAAKTLKLTLPATDGSLYSVWLGIIGTGEINYSLNGYPTMDREPRLADATTVDVSGGKALFLENLMPTGGEIVIEIEADSSSATQIAGVYLGDAMPGSEPQGMQIAHRCGSWTQWHGPPLYVFDNGNFLVGVVNPEGYTEIAHVTAATGAVSSFVPSGANADKDDHNGAHIIKMPNGNLMASWSGHGVEDLTYVLRSNTPEPVDSSDWDPVMAIDYSGSSPSWVNKTYAQLHVIGSDIWLISRGSSVVISGITHGQVWSYMISSDNGATWSTPEVLNDKSRLKGTGCYTRSCVDSANDRIHFFSSNGRCTDRLTRGYHYYTDGTNWYNTDGTTIKAVSAGPVYLDEDLAPSSLVCGAIEGEIAGGLDVGVPNSQMWDMDLAIDADGNPVIAWQAIYDTRGNLDRLPTALDETEATRTIYMVARWTGERWINEPVACAGQTFAPGIATYGPGFVFVPGDPDCAIFSSNAAQPSRCDVESPLSRSGVHELWVATRAKGARGWGMEPLTVASPRKNYRPAIARSPDGSKIRLIWMRGGYVNYADCDAQTASLDLSHLAYRTE